MGFTCPNIDGTVARGGCIYCENESFSPNLTAKSSFKLSPSSPENPFLARQLEQLEYQYTHSRTRLAKKFGAKKFIVYFQSFTNTYAPFETLKALYDRAFELEGAIGVSIGTRTDAISDEVLDYLCARRDEGKEVWVEYGIQSIHDATLRLINRGHDYKSAAEVIRRTKERGLDVCVHLIFGLPGETQEMMLDSVREVANLGIDSLKIHPLYITKHTKLAKEYKEGRFEPISEEAYLATLVQAVQTLPQGIYLQRVTAGIGDNSLLAPRWCYDGHGQKNRAKAALKRAGIEY
jgi:radical SAM protein (TIGR01212 family)